MITRNELNLSDETTSNRRNHILMEAAKIIRRKGFAGATMRDIAHAVGLEVGSLYNHIHSKQEILTVLCFSIAREYIAGLENILQSEASFPDKMSQVIMLHCQLAAHNQDAMQVFEEEWKHLNADTLQEFKTMRHNYENMLLSFIEKGIACDHFRSLQPKWILYTLLSSMKWLNFYFRDNKSVDFTAITTEVKTLIMFGNTHQPQ